VFRIESAYYNTDKKVQKKESADDDKNNKVKNPNGVRFFTFHL